MEFLGNLVSFLINVSAAALIIGVVYLGVDKLRSRTRRSGDGDRRSGDTNDSQN